MLFSPFFLFLGRVSAAMLSGLSLPVKARFALSLFSIAEDLFRGASEAICEVGRKELEESLRARWDDALLFVAVTVVESEIDSLLLLLLSCDGF